ncbi:MAG: DUF6544 family protein [Ginsengibacter sp.]
MLYVLIFIALVVIIVIALKVNLTIRFNKEVKQLFTQSTTISGKKFSYEQLVGLPEPVQHYFKYVLKEGQPYINYVRLTHNGQFKSGKKNNWTNIKGEQYFTTEKPGFIWKGKTSMFTARDMYIADKGRLVASLFSLINIVNGQGGQYNQGELLRWLAESVWFPTNLLPGKNLRWTPIDSQTAKLNFNYNGLSLFYIVKFNDKGEITQMETKRYMDEKNLETWICKLDKYEERNKIIIPTEAEVLWRLKEGDFSYAKFKVQKIEYDKPAKF